MGNRQRHDSPAAQISRGLAQHGGKPAGSGDLHFGMQRHGLNEPARLHAKEVGWNSPETLDVRVEIGPISDLWI